MHHLRIPDISLSTHENFWLNTSASPTGHHFEEETLEIFRFRNRRNHGVIGRLLEPAQPPRGTPGIDKRVRDC